jgi:hypothetical protein
MHRILVAADAGLGGDVKRIAVLANPGADPGFRQALAIDVGGIEMDDAAIDQRAQQRIGPGVIDRPPALPSDIAP